MSALRSRSVLSVDGAFIDRRKLETEDEGHVLKNESSTLSACGLQDGHVVHLVERPADMPLPSNDGELSGRAPHSHHQHHHGRFFQNMFGSRSNERERITYVVPFERNGVVTDNNHIEELVRRAISNTSFLTESQRSGFDLRWDSANSLIISLPPYRNPHIASPALERIALIDTMLDQIAHFRGVVEGEGGFAEKVDEFLEGTHRYDEENTAAFNEQALGVALALERDPARSSRRLIDTFGSEQVGDDESVEHEARYQRIPETNETPSCVMRHAISGDLVGVLRRLQDEQEALRPHLVRFERILNSRILYNIDDQEQSNTDYRANFFTVYMEHLQRVVHRLSHAWHLTSDLSVYLHTPLPRRLLPNYQQFQVLPPTEGDIVLEFHSVQSTSSSEVTTDSPLRFISLPPPGVDVQELTNEEVRIIGMNPTVRRMQQMGIAVPIPVTSVAQVNTQPTPHFGHQRTVGSRRFMTPRRNIIMPSNTLHPPPGFPVNSVSSSRSDASRPTDSGAEASTSMSIRLQNRRPVTSTCQRGEERGGTAQTHDSSSGLSLQSTLINLLEHDLPSADSNNAYERFMSCLLRLADDESVDIAGLLRSPAVRRAFNRDAEHIGSDSYMSPSNPQSTAQAPVQFYQRASIPSLGSLARGVISQSGSELPFMSEVISNIMRSNGLGTPGSSQVDVIVEYGQNGSLPSADNEHQQQMVDMAMGGFADDQGRHPTAVGYHVEVHQFDIYRQPGIQDQDNTTVTEAYEDNSSSIPSSSAAESNLNPEHVLRASTMHSDFVHNSHNRGPQPRSFPAVMSGMGFPPEMHVTNPRQDIVSVDPFLSCGSRFTDVQRVLRDSHLTSTPHLSPYRRFMRTSICHMAGSCPHHGDQLCGQLPAMWQIEVCSGAMSGDMKGMMRNVPPSFRISFGIKKSEFLCGSRSLIEDCDVTRTLSTLGYDAQSSNDVTDRRVTSVEGYAQLTLSLNSAGEIIMTDEDVFERFMQLAIRSALSQMIHTDQDRNSQNVRGSSPRVFPSGQSMHLPGGGEIVQATVSAPILVHAEVEQHPHARREPAVVDNRIEDVLPSSNDMPNDSEQEGVIPHHGLTELELLKDFFRQLRPAKIANNLSDGMQTTVAAILDESRTPSLMRPGNGAGVLAHLQALLCNFVTLGDLANMSNDDMSPLELHRSHFRSHVIENQLNGNSTPTSEDLSSAAIRLAAPQSSISSVIRAAEGELERDWNGRRMNIPATIFNVEVATIQRLLRALFDRTISDAEFSNRIQNVLRDYVRYLVALGNHCFGDANEATYTRLACELLVRADNDLGRVDTNVSRLLHFRNCIPARIAVLLQEQGRFPNLDEIPSRLLVWSALENSEVQADSSEVLKPKESIRHPNEVEAGEQLENVANNETRYRGVSSNGPTAAKRRKLDEEEIEPSTSQSCFSMSHIVQPVLERNAAGNHSQPGSYNGDWRQSFPEWVQTIENDVLSGQTNPRRTRNPSDMYQSAHPDQERRQMVSESASEEQTISSLLRDVIENALSGSIPASVDEHLNSPEVIDAFTQLMDSAVLHRIEEDPDFDASRYPHIARHFTEK